MMFYIFHTLRMLGATELDTSPLPNSDVNNAPSVYIQTGLQIVFGILGAVALLVIVLSGLRYMLAQGDPGKVAQARSTILYAVIGLVVALSAFSIVTFVVGVTD